ncbi:MAG: hypothetical protein NTX49_05880 [Chlamydiae bacterium]|nr:hypothetical protein [Chlamydiota bacterium]
MTITPLLRLDPANLGAECHPAQGHRFTLRETLSRQLCHSIDKISLFAQKIFVSIKSFLLFPLRYCGSKTWSLLGMLTEIILRKPVSFARNGYHDHFEKLSNPIDYLPFASMSNYIHKKDLQWITPFGYSPVAPSSLNMQSNQLSALDYCFLDPNSGLKIALVEKENEIVIIFGALASYTTELENQPEQLKKVQRKLQLTVASNLLGGTPSIYTEAHSFVKDLLVKPHLKGKKITLYGASFGGSIASYVALKLHLQGICINSLQLGAGLQQNIGDKELQLADQYLTHISVKDDYLTDPPVIGYLDRAVSFLGVRTPGNFGKKYIISTSYRSSLKIHSYMLGSFMHNLGFHYRTLPVNLPESILKRFQSKPLIQSFWNGQSPLELLIRSRLEPGKKLQLIKRIIDLGADIPPEDGSHLRPCQVDIPLQDRSISPLLHSEA